MESMTNIEEHREFLEYFRAHVDPNDQLPVRVPGYHLLESEIDGEVINWVLQYLLQMKCPQSLLVPIVNEVVQETRKSYLKIPKQCGFDGYAYNPLKLSAIVISHTNGICERLLDNAELNEILAKSSAPVLSQTPKYCVKAIKNTRRKMEDRHVCIGDFNGMFAVKDTQPTSFYGVFDGHGGQDAAFFTAAHLCYNIAKSSKYPQNIDGAIKDSFLKTDVAFIDKSDKHALNCGTTALVCIYRAIEKRLFVGWVGDSQALLVCEGKVCQIVSPHVPSVESECARIEKLGGVVLNWNGSYRVNGQLAVSRAIGDAPLKPYITGEPDISSITLEGKEDFLIIASDGLWESLTEDFIALFVYRMVAENPECAESIADKLVESAKKGTSDNITVVVVFFKDPHLIAKSSWLNKMEATYDKNNTNSAFGNDTSHFKFSNMDDGLNMSSDMPESNEQEQEEHQMIPSPTITKNNYNETNNVHINDKSTNVVDHHQQFVDDFGPETDVDAMDDSNATKYPVDVQTHDSINEYNLSNGAKPFSLETKIIQQLSEQNREFLSDSNPFKNDHFDQFSDDHVMLDQTIAKIPSSSGMVDNKIIDALESLEVSNGDQEKYELESEKQMDDLLDTRQKSPEMPDFTEKVDYNHEKSLFTLDAASEVGNTCPQHIDNTFNQTVEQDPSVIEKVVETACVEESVGEDTEEEEEEDEWNYIKGDKKTDESLPSSSVHGHQNLNEAQLAVYSAQEIEPAGIKTECVELPVPNIATDLQLLDFYVDTNNAEKADSVEQEKENLNDATAVAEATPSHDPESNKLAEDTFADHQEQPAVLIQQELAHTHENISIASSSAITPIPAENVNLSRDHPEETERIPLQEQASAFITEEKDLADILTEPSAKLIADDASSLEVLAEDTVSPDIEVEHEPETVAEKREVEQNEASVIQQPTEEQSSLESETSVDEDLERPNSLSLEMASKLNPEAKEFVPVSSPSRSNPTSPVANPSTMIGNPYLLLDDDAVVAQSPKKCTATMDNIDVPEEDDFQHEMDIRPHELEKPSEFVNGTTEMSARSHSPASEQSYQELNLKEAMQADEKLEHDYNDDKQVVPEDSPLELSGEQEILNVLNKEQDPMNMSFYEGRDEALLSNSDELNKVHVLPEEDDFEEQSNDDGKKLKMCQTAPVEPVRDVDMLEDKVEIKERVTAPQSEENIHVESKSPLQEEPSAAIFAVASQVVNDVAALVDQMHIESVVSNDRLEAEIQQDDKLELDQRLTVTEDNVMEPSQDIMISLEKQNEITPLEDAVVMERHVESSHPNIAGDNINIHTAESDDLVSPMVEAMEHEVVAENEFITDESVLNVIPSPLLCKFSAEAPVEYDQAVKETANETPTQLNNATVPVPTVDTQTTNLLESVTPILDQIVSTPVATVEEPKLAIVASKSTTAKVTATTKSAATTKTMASKTVSKPTTTTANRKLPMVSKASPKAAPPKSSVSARPSTATSPAKKSTTVSHATATTTTSRTVGAAKPSTASSATHVSLAPTTTNKTAVAEKKAPLVAKKTGTSAINADLKAAPTSRKPLATTILKTSTVTKSVSTTSSTSIVPSARLSGTSVKSTSAKPLSTAAKSSTSAPSKPASATSRTVSTAPAAKPRTVPSTVNKTASATSTSTMASKISQGSSSSVTKRVSTVGTATSRTTTATKAPTASTTKTSSVSSRTSTVLKQGSSSTTSTVRKTTTTLPTKKPVTSPSTKTTTKASSTGKIAASSTKVVVSNHINDVKASVTEEFISNDLLDLDKQLKNDNNQLITKNGIDPQMMVIDLAAD